MSEFHEEVINGGQPLKILRRDTAIAMPLLEVKLTIWFGLVVSKTFFGWFDLNYLHTGMVWIVPMSRLDELGWTSTQYS